MGPLELSSSRREWLRAVFGGALAASLPLAGCDKDKPRPSPIVGALGGPSVKSGHKLRGPALQALLGQQVAISERVDVAVIGGGPAGLSAAWRLKRKGVANIGVYELEGAVGGTSLGGESPVTAYPWGAHYLPVPRSDNPELVGLLREMGVVTGADASGEPVVGEPHLVRHPGERLYYKGFWYPGLYLRVGASPQDLQELARFRAIVDRYVAMRDSQGRRAFTLPVSGCSDDASLTALDRLSAAQWMRDQGLSSPRLRWWLDYACRDDYGQGLEHTSAWALLFYFASRMAAPGKEAAELITWPQGNAALVAHLAGAVRDRVHAGLLAYDLHHDAEGCHLHLWDTRHERPVHVLAKHAVVALPRFIAARVVRGLREADDASRGFSYSPWMVANLHLRARPGERGHPPAWDNVLYDSPSLGYVSATHQRGRDFGPSVWTYYLPLIDPETKRARGRLFEAPWEHWRDAVIGDLSRAHPDLSDHVTRLDVHRWGHAMVRPSVGFIWGADRRRARQALGPIHFAHSDLSGVALFEEAFDHGLRAADEVLAAVKA